MKTEELEGAALNRYVALAEGYTYITIPPDAHGKNASTILAPPGLRESGWEPAPLGKYGDIIKNWCGDWSEGGQILEREKITVHDDDVFPWRADHPGNNRWYFGDTYLIAAMRAFVASKFGDEVPDIKETA